MLKYRMPNSVEKPVKRDLAGREIKEIDANKILKEKKKNEILEIYASETGLPLPLLEHLWLFCENTPEKKLKQIKKGQYKNKVFNPVRPQVENGQVFETATIRDLTEEELNQTGKLAIPIIEEISEDKNETDNSE